MPSYWRRARSRPRIESYIEFSVRLAHLSGQLELTFYHDANNNLMMSNEEFLQYLEDVVPWGRN